jgi:pimeloyl-ACP methyl ester carboxylesterase
MPPYLRASRARTQRSTTPSYASGAVKSADGTTIGYRKLGRGPGLILLHGGMMAAQNFMQLAAALSDSFSVFVPDRRGRGASGPFGAQYSLGKECEDVRALVELTSAHDVFGLSSGALIALEAALTVPGIRRVAAYEPPLSIAGRDLVHWLPRFDREVAQGKLAAAMLTVIKGTGDWKWVRFCPYFLLTPLLNLAMYAQGRNLAPGDVALRALIPTMHYDAQLVREASDNIERYHALRWPTLLLGGSQSARFLTRVLDALKPHLSHAERVELKDVGHIAADNEGNPERVAQVLREFFERPLGAPD